MLVIKRKHRDTMLYYSKEQLETRALKILAEYNYDLLKTPQPVDIEDIIEYHYKLEIDYKKLSKENNILGMIAFESGYIKVFDDFNNEEIIEVRSGTILIDNRIINDSPNIGRYRFTCAHELSHWELHKDLYFKTNKKIRENCGIKCLNRDVEDSFNKSIILNKQDWLEWQADFLAASLLMPMPTVKICFESKRKEVNCNKIGTSSLDINKQVIKEMSSFFQVSEQSMLIRLKNLKLI